MTACQSSSRMPQREVVAGDPGIVDEDIDPAHRRLGLAQQAVGRRRVGEIGRHHMRPLAELRRPGRRAPPARVPASATVAPGDATPARSRRRCRPRRRSPAPSVRSDRTFTAVLAACKGFDLARRADRNRRQRAVDPLDEAGEHPPGADLDDLLDLRRSANASTLSRQRTICVTCSTSSSLISAGSLVGAAVTLATSGTSRRLAARFRRGPRP